MTEKENSTKLKELAASLVAFGKINGAEEIEVSIVDGYEFNVDVRLGKIENLVEAGSRYLGLRILKDKKTAFATSSDLSRETLQSLVKNAIKRTSFASQDEFSGLPAFSSRKINISSLRLFDPEISNLDSEKKISLAMETEKIALEDKRITNSHGATFQTNEIKSVLANSNGFLEEYDQTYFGLSVGLQAGDTDSRVEGSWFSSKIYFNELARPEEIAQKAVERTVRQLNPRKIRTQNVPVIFEPLMTSWILGFLFTCVSGVSIYQKISFLADKLEERISNSSVTVIDNGLTQPGS